MAGRAGAGGQSAAPRPAGDWGRQSGPASGPSKSASGEKGGPSVPGHLCGLSGGLLFFLAVYAGLSDHGGQGLVCVPVLFLCGAGGGAPSAAAEGPGPADGALRLPEPDLGEEL